MLNYLGNRAIDGWEDGMSWATACSVLAAGSGEMLSSTPLTLATNASVFANADLRKLLTGPKRKGLAQRTLLAAKVET